MLVRRVVSWPFAGPSAMGNWAPCSPGRAANIFFCGKASAGSWGFSRDGFPWWSVSQPPLPPRPSPLPPISSAFFRGSRHRTPTGPFLNRPFWTSHPSPLLAVGVIIFFSIIQGYSLLLGSRVQNLLTGFKIAIILIFIVAGFTAGNGSIGNFSVETPLDSILSTGFAGSLIFVSFAYSGWNAAAYLGSEIKNPPQETYPSPSSGEHCW